MTIITMSLRLKGWRKIVKWVLWGLLGLLFLIFLIRVITFEAHYYDEKDGSEREVAEVNESESDVVEVAPSEDEIKEYVVAPERPRYLTIEKIGINKARILPMGVNSKGELDTPINIFDVGWYEASGLPGQGGTMIIDGHNGGPHVLGVFKKLPDLGEGDVITVERGDGIIYRYMVVENVTVPLDESDAYMSTAAKTPQFGKESISLISCTGEWSQQQRTYLSRQFVRAILTE